MSCTLHSSHQVALLVTVTRWPLNCQEPADRWKDVVVSNGQRVTLEPASPDGLHREIAWSHYFWWLSRDGRQPTGCGPCTHPSTQSVQVIHRQLPALVWRKPRPIQLLREHQKAAARPLMESRLHLLSHTSTVYVVCLQLVRLPIKLDNQQFAIGFCSNSSRWAIPYLTHRKRWMVQTMIRRRRWWWWSSASPNAVLMQQLRGMWDRTFSSLARQFNCQQSSLWCSWEHAGHQDWGICRQKTSQTGKQVVNIFQKQANGH